MAAISKILDYLDTFSVKPYYINDSGQSAANSASTENPFVSPQDYTFYTDNLHWDEYGNPYVN